MGFAHRKVAPEIRYYTRSRVQATVAQQKDLAEATEFQLDNSECGRCQYNETDLCLKNGFECNLRRF